MTSFGDPSLWLSLLIAALILFGASLVLLGAIGLVRLNTFYKRVHAPTLGTSIGTFSILAGSIIYFSAAAGRPIFHEILVGIFVSLTTPITFMLLVRAALYRDQQEKKGD
jgi:multicomponent K+:H+ antiporter subunit G